MTAYPLTVTLTIPDPQTAAILAELCGSATCLLGQIVARAIKDAETAATRAEQPQDEREGR